MARLDRLGLGPKKMAQIGAAIGREFSYELLTAVAGPSERLSPHAVEVRRLSKLNVGDDGRCLTEW